MVYPFAAPHRSVLEQVPTEDIGECVDLLAAFLESIELRMTNDRRLEELSGL